MSKRQIREWFLSNGFILHEDDKNVFMWPYQNNQCFGRFVIGKKRLFYDIYVDGSWVLAFSQDFMKLKVDSESRLEGLECGLFIGV